MVSAVILNYLNPDLTYRCVAELMTAAHESGIETEIIVVDNSAPQTAATLHQKLPNEVTVIENENNVGFSEANNKGIQQARGELVLIMNNDLFLNAATLQKGVDYIENHTKVGVWAPMLTDKGGCAQRSCSRFPSLTGVISEYLFKLQYDNRIARSAVEAQEPVKVDMVIGACMLIPKRILQEVGGFDEDYFFNTEDVDLCLRIKELGYEVIFDPRCSAVHLVGASQDHYWHNNTHLHESRILYFRKNHHPLKAGLAAFFIRTGVALRMFKQNVWPA